MKVTELTLVFSLMLLTYYISGQEKVGINTPQTNRTHTLTITSQDNNTLRLIGPGDYGSLAKLEFGDLPNRVFIHEDVDDKLQLYSSGRISLMGGNIGLGTLNPSQLLTLSRPTDAVVLRFERSDPTRWDYEIVNDGGSLIFRGGADDVGTNLNRHMMIHSNGNVGIGTTDDANSNLASGYKLSVNGKIASNEVRVQPTIEWPDYVFAEDYQLMPLQELKKAIERVKHLPGIPSAEEVKENGVELGEMQRKMMEKIEELTLYIIDLQQEIEQLKKDKQ